MDRALPERRDDRSDRRFRAETVPERTDAFRRRAGTGDHRGDDPDPFFHHEICGANELSGFPDRKAQDAGPDLQEDIKARHELQREGDHGGAGTGIGRGSGPAGELFWPVCAAVFLRIPGTPHPVRPVYSRREPPHGAGPSDLCSADPRDDHDGAEDRQEDPGQILDPVHAAGEHVPGKPAGHDDTQDLQGGRAKARADERGVGELQGSDHESAHDAAQFHHHHGSSGLRRNGGGDRPCDPLLCGRDAGACPVPVHDPSVSGLLFADAQTRQLFSCGNERDGSQRQDLPVPGAGGAGGAPGAVPRKGRKLPLKERQFFL